jgi:hypothetical protein
LWRKESQQRIHGIAGFARFVGRVAEDHKICLKINRKNFKVDKAVILMSAPQGFFSGRARVVDKSGRPFPRPLTLGSKCACRGPRRRTGLGGFPHKL